MLTIYAQLFGVTCFVVATIVLGRQIRRTPTAEAAQRLSRVSHTFFWAGLVVPELAGVVWPGLTHFDEVVGVASLPDGLWRWALGLPLLLAGLFFTAASARALKTLGAGSMAFKLTKKVVDGDVYERVRNPMSLGAYLQYLGVSLLVGSTTLLAGTLFLYIPAHVFNLKYFEELELRARHGEGYERYRERVPFLVPRLFGNR